MVVWFGFSAVATLNVQLKLNFSKLFSANLCPTSSQALVADTLRRVSPTNVQLITWKCSHALPKLHFEYNVYVSKMHADCFLFFDVDNYLYPLCIALWLRSVTMKQKENLTITTSTQDKNNKNTQPNNNNKTKKNNNIIVRALSLNCTSSQHYIIKLKRAAYSHNRSRTEGVRIRRDINHLVCFLKNKIFILSKNHKKFVAQNRLPKIHISRSTHKQ